MGYRVISKPNCPHCVRAKQALTIRGLDYTEDLRQTPAEIQAFVAEGFRTFPQVFDPDGKHIGGADDLIVHLAEAF